MAKPAALMPIMVANAVLVVVDEASKGRLTPKPFVAGALLYVGLSLLAEPMPGIAVSLAGLILLGQVYRRGPNVARKLRGFAEGV